MPNETTVVTVLDQNGTFAPTEGTFLAAVPDSVIENDEVEQFLKDYDYDKLPIGEVKDSATIATWFRIFFPGMQIEQDNDGQVIIYTGINE